mgnify:CR=1 FL=1|jgi:hypothetical protein
MKKFFASLPLSLLAFAISLFLAVPAFAATLSITRIGTTDVSSLGLGTTLKNYTYAGTTFEMAGTASPSSTVSIVVDDVTRTATADTTGAWSDLLSSILVGSHAVKVTSGTSSLSFTLNISSASATTTATTSSTTTATASSVAATTKGGLPVSGGVEDTMLVLAAAALIFGLGITVKARSL